MRKHLGLSMNNLKLQIKTLDNHKELKLPFYATPGSAGMDLLAAIDENIVLYPMERLLVSTGISIALPKGLEAQIRPRSGLAFKNGITVLNSPGTIDSDYRGEIKVLLVNLSKYEFVINRGMRIAQMVIADYKQVHLKPVIEFIEEVENVRNSGGFGSTGI